MKQNDWIVANINNPNFSAEDFQDAGMSLDNTQMLSRDEYLKSKFITDNPNFQDDAGAFSKEKFNEYYNQTLSKFNDFTKQTDNFKYDIFNPRYTPNSRTRDYDFDMKIVPNPDHVGYGTGARDEISSPTMSPMEYAETQKIFNTATQSFMNETPNDLSLFSSPIKFAKQMFSAPLVMAQWEDDSFHIDPLTGEKKKHKKGDYKLNEEGQYYTETLNGRNPMNKRVISLSSLLTIDGSPANKYDFFDSDDIEKSTTGIIAKTAASIVPLFIPYVDIAYGSILAAREMLKTGPMLYGMMSSLFNSDNTESKTANTLQGMAMQLSGDVSDYSKQNNFTFENIASMLSDVALQWAQQKAIVKGISQLRGSSTKVMAEAEAKAKNLYDKKVAETNMTDWENYGDVIAADMKVGGVDWKATSIGQAALRKYVPKAVEIVKNNQKIGQDLSLVYMALISNTDVFNDLRNYGASKREAALFTLGSTLGMFGVDKFAHLGEMFFDEENEALNKSIRGAFKNATKEWKDEFLDSYVGKGLENSKSGISKWLSAGMSVGKGSTNNVINSFMTGAKEHSLGFFGKALGEGLEEVSEEVVTDLSKEIYQVAGQLGFDTSVKNVNAFNNGDIGALTERYFMNFLGGFMGGGIFYGVGKFKDRGNNHDTKLDEMIYLLREGHGDMLKKRAGEWHKEGKFGSTTLSALKTETDSDGNKVRITANDGDITENDYVYNKLLEEINQVSAILETNNTNKTDDELFDQMILSDVRFRKLAGYLKDSSYTTKYQELYQDLSTKLVKITKDIELASATKTGTVPVDENGNRIDDVANIPENQRYLDKYRENKGIGYEELNNNRNANLKKLSDIKLAIQGEIQAYHDGTKSMPYTDMLLFSMDSNINSPFVQMNFESWLLANFHQQPQDLSESELAARSKEYRNYKKGKQSLDLKEQFNNYTQLRKQLTPLITSIQEQVGDISQLGNELDNFFQDKKWLYNGVIKSTEKLDTESDEEFANTQLHAQKMYEHNIQIMLGNIQKVQEILDKHPGQFVDPVTARYILREVGARTKDQVREHLSRALNEMQFMDGNDLIGGKNNTVTELVHIFKGLNNNATNIDEVKESIETVMNNKQRTLNQTFKNPFFELASRKILLEHPEYEFEDLMNEDSVGFKELLEKDNQINVRKFIEQIIGHNIESAEGDIVQDFHDSLDQFYTYVKNNMEKFATPDYNADTIIQQLDVIMSNAKKFNTYEEYEDTLNNIVENVKTQALNALQKTQFNLMNDQVFNLLNSLRITKENPLMPLIRSLALHTNKNTKNIEELCRKLEAQFNKEDNVESFIIEDEADKNDIEDALMILRMAKSFVYGASTISTFKEPIGHNKMINDFAKRNGVMDFAPLAEMDGNLAALLYQELDKYIAELDPNRVNSWSFRSSQNESNKLQQFTNAKAKFEQVRRDFWKSNVDTLKISEDVNLLDGYIENMPLHSIENLVYDNVHKYLAQGHTFSELLNTGFMDRMIKMETLYKQKSSRLDDRLDSSKFTSNDKLVYFMTTIGLRSDTFNKFLLNKINEGSSQKIIPLDIQEYLAKVAIAHIKNGDLYDALFAYLEESKQIDLPMFKNLLFVSGVGGSGKTMVIASYVKSFFQDSKMWVGAPSTTQVVKLSNNLTVSDAFTKQELLDKMIGKEDYEELSKKFEKAQSTAKDMQSTQDNVVATEITKSDDAPKILVIDEITHFSTLDLAILNKWAAINNVRVVTLGDESQNGYSDKIKIANIDTDNCFVIRTPKLFLSLRDANIQKAKNQKELATIIDSLLENIADPDSHTVAVGNALTQLRNFALHVYNYENLAGDLLTGAMPMDIVQKIKHSLEESKDSTVGYLGSTSSDTFKMLKDNGINPIVFNNEQDLQGQEVTYMVVDPTVGFWNEYASIYKNPNIGTLAEFLRKVYTLISRGQEGTIIVDKDKGLRNLIGENTIDGLTSKVKSLSETAVSFKEARKAELESMKFTEEPTFEITPEEKTITETKPEPTKSIKEVDVNVDEKGNSKLDKEDSMTDKEIVYSRNVEAQSREPLVTDIKGECRVYTQGIDGVTHSDNGDWLVGNNTNDINIFIPGDVTRVSTGVDKGHYFELLNKFKKDLLFRAGDFDSLDAATKQMFLQTDDLEVYDGGKYAWENAKFYVEVRPVTVEDNLVGLSDLSNDKLADENGLIRTVTMEFARYDRKICRLTLGLLPNVNTFANYINNNEVSDEQKANFMEYQKLVNMGPVKFEIERPTESAITYLIREDHNTPIEAIRNIIKDSEGNELPEEEQRKSVDADKNVISFKERYQYLTYSAPHVYMGGLDDPEFGVSDHCLGMQVLFVSDDPYMSRNELMDEYIKEKEGEVENQSFGPRRVRMMPLDPRGLSFSDLINPLFRDIITTNFGNNATQAISHFPFDTARVGLKMYATLWNSRANLIQFITSAVENTPEEFAGVDNLFENIEFLNYAKEQLRNADINRVNSILRGSRQEQFRLNDGSNPYYIKWDEQQAEQLGYNQEMSDEQKQQFIANNKLDNYIHISPDRAIIMLEQLNNLISLFSPIIKLTSSDGNAYPVNHSIDPVISDKATNTPENSVGKLLLSDSTYSEGSLVIKTVDGDEATFTYNFDIINKNDIESKNTYAGFKLVPMILTKAAKIVSLKNAEKTIYKNSMTLHNLDKTKEESIDFSSLLSSVGSTTDFLNNLSLIFHGTTAAISNESSFRATVAPFKYGFRTFPILFLEGLQAPKDKVFRKAATSEALFSTNVAVTSIFNIKLKPKSPPVTLNVNKVLGEVATIQEIIDKFDDKTPFINCKTIDDINKVIYTQVTNELEQDEVNIWDKVLGVSKEGNIIKSTSVKYTKLEGKKYRFKVGENSFMVFDGKNLLKEKGESLLEKEYKDIISKFSKQTQQKLEGLTIQQSMEVLDSIYDEDSAIEEYIDQMYELASRIENDKKCNNV